MLQTLKEITLSTEHHFESAVAIKNSLLLQIIFKANVLVAKVVLRPDFFPCCINNGNVSWLFLSSISSNLSLGTVLLSCLLHLRFPRVKLSSRSLNPCKILWFKHGYFYNAESWRELSKQNLFAAKKIL